jgi:acyl-CoA reductase-like NAD-dependent aldehyde dehydrogenase
MHDVLRKLGLESVNPGGYCGEWIGSGEKIDSLSPIDGKPLAAVKQVTPEEYDRIVDRAHAAFLRSEERRVGKECERLCRSRWSPDH